MRALFAAALAAGLPGIVHALDLPAITYEVVNNNRMFEQGDAEVFEKDLNTYLHCIDAANKHPSRMCRKYRKDGTINRGTRHEERIPNLRRRASFDEYRTSYDKTAMAYPAGFATDLKRTLVFRPQANAAAVTGRGAKCSWTLSSSAAKPIRAVKQSCASARFEVELEAAKAGKPPSFNGTVTLQVTNSKTTRHDFSVPVYSRDYLLVAFGDSFTSGEGNPEKNVIPGDKPVPAQWLDYRCHRTVFSYPVMLAHMLSLADPRHSVTLLHFGCSGARTTTGVMQPYLGALSPQQTRLLWRDTSDAIPNRWKTYGRQAGALKSQLEQAKSALAAAPNKIRPDLVVMSIGVNDMGLVPFLTAIAEDEFDLRELKRTWPRAPKACTLEEDEPRSEEAVISDNRRRLHLPFACLDKRLERLDKMLDRDLTPKSTYLMEYLNPLLDDQNRQCGLPHHRQLLERMLDELTPLEKLIGGFLYKTYLNRDELDFALRDFYKPLIATSRSAADRIGWQYIHASEQEHQRGFCARISWYHKFAASRARQGIIPGERLVSTGTLHPNTFGQYYAAMRALIATSKDDTFKEHNVYCLRGTKMASTLDKEPNPDGTFGFAWYIWNRHIAAEKGNLARNYHAGLSDAACTASRR